MEFHPVANIFPLMVESEIASLAKNIAEIGLLEPIWLDAEGRIIDGRNRFLACQRAKVEPKFQTYDGAQPIEFVVSMNLHRRHLSESQRGMVAAEIANLKNGQRADMASRSQADYIYTPPVSIEQAAEMLNVSRATVSNAKVVLRDGTPEQIAAVRDGSAAVYPLAKELRAANQSPEKIDPRVGSFRRAFAVVVQACANTVGMHVPAFPPDIAESCVNDIDEAIRNLKRLKQMVKENRL